MAFPKRRKPLFILVCGIVLMKAAVVATCLVSILGASEYTVVVSKKSSFPVLTVSQIRDVFLQKRRNIGDEKVIPVNVLGHEEVRSLFEAKVLGMDRNRLNAYWVKQHFQGVTPPLTQPSFESVKAFVENVDGAIGYLPAYMVDGKLRGVYEF